MNLTGLNAPIGAVIPYCGGDMFFPPIQWAAYAGDVVPLNEETEALHQVIGTRFTTSRQDDSYVLPNISGLFIRGVDLAGNTDPDCDARSAAPDGTAGRKVGTLQAYATAQPSSKSGNFTTTVNHYDTTAGPIPPISDDEGPKMMWPSENITKVSFGGDSETRPSNANVRYYIKGTTLDPSLDDSPVGGIIAIPYFHYLGDGSTNSKWEPAFGQLVSATTDPDMAGLSRIF